MLEVRLGKLSEEVDESLVVLWHVAEGEKVKAGDTLVEVQTEKAVSEIEAEEDGTVIEILVPRGRSAKVGEVLAKIETANAKEKKKEDSTDPVKAEEASAGPKEKDKKTFIRVPPRLRRLAGELGVNLQQVKGTGSNGNITESDIRKAANKEADPAVDRGDLETGTAVPLTGMRKAIARKMMDSLHSSAQLTETSWAEVTMLAEEREKMDQQASWTAIIAKAVITALAGHSSVNAHIKEEKVFPQKEIHLGIAVDTKEGLMVPVLHHADQYSVSELHEEIRRLAEKAREGRLAIEEQSGSTFTITSLGSYPVQFFTPIINPPEVAILGTGKIEPYLALENGLPVERQRLPLSFTFDHRALDGAPAARFLADLNAVLEEPERLLPKPFQV